MLGETFLAFALFLTLGALLGPAQYGGAALNRPYVDSSLAAADAAMGINVGELAAWTGRYPWLVTALTRAYYTLLSQFYGFDPVGIDQSRVFRHLDALRSGTMTVVKMGDLDGLVSAPSFHVLGAMCVTWAFRHRPWILAALVIFPCTVWMYRRVEHLLDPVARA